MVFVETPTFARSATRLIDEDDLAVLQTALMLRPDAGPVIPGSGGLRKLRIAAKGHGKRGGARVIYYWRNNEDQIFLLFAYAKNERANLTVAQLRALRQSIEL